ncbi:MAG TPA: class I SAM-dependent RNA methyltransferase [Pyrinomonadaceae bacterium]|nr:class I SAM-dependent RNA methyltransferase [Pyrinomonadaceae bacterium]
MEPSDTRRPAEPPDVREPRDARGPRGTAGPRGSDEPVEPREFEVTIERILPGGLGLAHADGRTILVALSAPGDRLRVRAERGRGRTLFASIVELLAPGPERVEPPCPYFGRCGGCDFQQLNYEAQLAAKSEIIRDCLRRIARVEPPAEIPVEPSPAAWRYRSRARWQFDPVRLHLGYYERGTHRVCDVVECPVAAPPMQERLSALRAEMSEGLLPEEFAEFEAAAGDHTVSLDPPVRPDDEREQERTILGERYRFDASCFFQINHELLGPLAAAGLGDAEGGSALDLYCGVGLFTLPLARRFGRVVGVEGNPASARYARRNLTDAGLATHARVETRSVADWFARRAASGADGGGDFDFDFVLLDPPRSGAEPQTVAGILALAPRHISYVSCDPATLARDLRALLEGGYHINSVRAFDMFPQTHHVETIVHLARD